MPARTCNCRGSQQFIVTWSGGSRTVKTEIEARSLARRMKGTYKPK